MDANHISIDLIRDGVVAMPMGSISDAEPPGSLSSHEPDGSRQVYLFGWHNGERGLWRSEGGYDIETKAVRQVGTLGLEKLSDLTAPYELSIYFYGKPEPMTVRFTADGN